MKKLLKVTIEKLEGISALLPGRYAVYFYDEFEFVTEKEAIDFCKMYGLKIVKKKIRRDS